MSNPSFFFITGMGILKQNMFFVKSDDQNYLTLFKIRLEKTDRAKNALFYVNICFYETVLDHDGS